MATYVSVTYLPGFGDRAVTQLLEFSDAGLPLRSLELLCDGATAYADRTSGIEVNGAFLSDTPIDHEYLKSSPGEFETVIITQAAFEREWSRHVPSK